MEDKPIPLAALAPLAATAWKHDPYSLDKFAELVALHAEGDKRSGLTSAYWMRPGRDSEGLTAEELRALVLAGAVPEGMSREGASGESVGINQHWLHSLEQFYAEVTVAWQAHVKRTEALVGTPAGRTWSDL